MKKKFISEQITPYIAVMISMLLALVCVWSFTGSWPWKSNPYNTFVLQAQSWLEGRLDMGKDYPWLELAIVNEKYYSPFPPFPSLLLLPFTVLFGTKLQDGWLAAVILLIGAYYAVRLYLKVRKSNEGLIFWTLFLMLGNGLLFLSVNGWVWFFAQNMCFTLSLMALCYAYEGNGGISLACLMASVGCRPMTAFFCPLLLWLLLRSEQMNHPDTVWYKLVLHKWFWAIAPVLLAGFYMVLNAVRFGNPFDFGHNHLPEFTRENVSYVDWSCIPENIRLYLRLPGIKNENDTLSYYTMNGVAFWIVCPFYISAIIAGIRALICKGSDKVTLLLLFIGSSAFILSILSHRTLGGWQFGDRYLVDVLPYLYFGVLNFMSDKRSYTDCQIPLGVWGVILHAIGTAACYMKWI